MEKFFRPVVPFLGYYLPYMKYMYEAHSVLNANDIVTQSTYSVPSYAMHRIKERCMPFQLMYTTLV